MAHRTSIYIHEPLHLTLACLPKNQTLVFIFDLFLQTMGSDFISVNGLPWHEDKRYFFMFQIKKQNFVKVKIRTSNKGAVQQTLRFSLVFFFFLLLTTVSCLWFLVSRVPGKRMLWFSGGWYTRPQFSPNHITLWSLRVSHNFCKTESQ